MNSKNLFKSILQKTSWDQCDLLNYLRQQVCSDEQLYSLITKDDPGLKYLLQKIYEYHKAR